MKKTIIALSILLSAFSFSAEPKYKLADIEQAAVQAEMARVAEQGTLNFIFADYNNYVAGLAKKEKEKNAKYDETKFENKKALYISGLKYIFGQLGYEASFDIKEVGKDKAEFKYYVDKTIEGKDSYYLDKAVIEILNNLYQKPTEVNFKLYSDAKLTKEKK
ncbi:hypothetical protein STFE110948_04355 [Streptobacillus felis]|uniref:Uncharacterized protein n=1 Tax=Streptobacillus felis TaxID=1384509 RepID=A0A7Z0T841_9FUSO|nr:hypothetical protein [Streptobacillus felis]NYV27514.1 hypothetical protein [Streptobacillus felis]